MRLRIIAGVLLLNSTTTFAQTGGKLPCKPIGKTASGEWVYKVSCNLPVTNGNTVQPTGGVLGPQGAFNPPPNIVGGNTAPNSFGGNSKK